MSSISPFDIPHVVNSICDDLTLHEIIGCKKVCKAWSDIFAPLEWRSLHLSCSPSPEKCNLILEHAHHIEFLTIHQDDKWLLESPRINFQRLSYLHILFSYDISDFYLSKHSLMLMNLSRWTELRLSFPARNWSETEPAIDPAAFAMAFSNCPPGVESLHISYSSSSHDAAEPNSPGNEPSTVIPSWKPLSLRKFCFDCEYDCSFEPLISIGLIPFLRHSCPLLEDLSLPSFPEDSCETLMKTIGAHCPKLERLRLNNSDNLETSFGLEVDYFGYITQPLKFLRIDLHYRHDTAVLEPLRRNGSDALEALEFLHTEYYGSRYIPPYHWFPNLKTVDYLQTHRGIEMGTWTRPLEPTPEDDSHREQVRREYTDMVNM